MKVFIKNILITLICVLFFNLAFVISVFSAELNEIELDDGSIIHAEVVALADGKYTVRSETLGTFTLDSSRVTRISKGGVKESVVSDMPVYNITADSLSAQNLKTKVSNVQADIMKDPQAMQMVTSMASDPAITQLLDDPEIAAASKAGDVARLMKNPKFRAIMQDSRIQEMATTMMDKSKE